MSPLTDLWNALTGFGTLALAGATFCIIRQGQRQRAETERQHRDRFKPICVLTPYSGVDMWDKRGALIETDPPGLGNPSCGIVSVHCVLRNVGVGPALKLRVKFRFPNRGDWTTEPWELSPLGPGESLGGEGKPLQVPIALQGSFTKTDLETVKGDLWEVWLEYEDLFGKIFKTVHSKAPFDTNPALFEWTTPPPGQKTQATMRSIPWVTYIEDRDRA